MISTWRQISRSMKYEVMQDEEGWPVLGNVYSNDNERVRVL